MNDNLRLTDSLNLTVYHSLYFHFPQQIEALQLLKKEKKYERSNAVNLLFIPVFTSFLESVLAELFDQYLQEQTRNATDLQKRLIENMEAGLYKATWKNYKEQFPTVFGQRMEDLVHKETMEAVVSLFQFRNQVIHGKQIIHTIENAGEEAELVSIGGHYKSLNEFFLKKGLITRSELADIGFINEKIIDYYLRHALLFVSFLYKEVMIPKGLTMIHTIKAHVLDKIFLPDETKPNSKHR